MLITILILFIPFFCLSQQYYGGSASVKVKDTNGNTRTINVTYPCYHSDISSTKTALLNELTIQKSYSSNFDSSVSYDIDSCD